MVVYIETKHDALTNFFSNINYGAKSVTAMKHPTQHMTCDSHTNLIPELQFFMILISILIPLGLIPILGFTKINDSNSNCDSSII